MKKRIGSVLLALALCLSLLPATALAEGEGDTESSATTTSATEQMPTYSGGSGKKDDPWKISSVKDLQLLANTINEGKAAGFDADAAAGGKVVAGNYYGYYFKQTADLDLSGIKNWDPIGYSGSCYFAGHYDGGGYTISNATSTGKNDAGGFATAGIFGWVAFGSVKNLTVKNADFFAEGNKNMSYAGGVLAVAYSCTVENCSVYDSKIESRRNPNNSNYAGGITGIALTSSFEKCASIGNTIRHGSFGGGFIGALNRGGNSNFTNCYVANCIVTGCSDTGAMNTLSGGFQSASMGGDAILKSCFVYDCVAQPDETSKATDYFGVFTANTQYGKVVATSCFYYDVNANDATVNADGAESKTVDEFADGTVAKLLGEAFTQGKLYPVFTTDPADYTAVDAAIKDANALNENNYKDFSAVKVALDAVVRGKKITEQSEVDAMAKSIKDAIAALQYKDADYTKVDEALAKANALNKNNYKNFSAVEAAVNAVVRDKKITEQSEVDAMAKAIEDAIAELVKKPSSSSSSRPSYSITTPDKTENGSVNISSTSAKRGSTVTITVTPDAGYVLDKLTVTDKDGKELSLTKKSDTEYTFVMPAGKVEITPSFVKQAEEPSRVFVDVKTGDYFYDAVLWAVEKGITNGTSAETFSPEAPCTRAQIVTFLWRAAGSPVVNYAMDLSDVAGDAYYAEAVRWALSEGITTGTSADQFSPDATCTREQAVTFLWRVAGSPAVSGESAFEDVGADAYYARAVAWAAQNGVTNGISQALFGTGSDCTRAQIVTFLYRAQQGK